MKKKAPAPGGFYIHFGVDGINTVFHNSVSKPQTGLCVQLKTPEDKKLVIENDVNNLCYQDDKIMLKPPSEEPKLAAPEGSYFNYIDYLIWVAVLATGIFIGFFL